MSKSILIKRLFARKTKNIKYDELKGVAEFIKNAENNCIELAKVASKIKKIIKSSDAEKLVKLEKKINNLKNKGEKPDLKEVELHNDLDKKFGTKILPLLDQFDNIIINSTFFNSEHFKYLLEKSTK